MLFYYPNLQSEILQILKILSNIQGKCFFFVVICSRRGDLFSSIFLTELWGFLFRSIDFLPAVFQLFPVSTRYNWNSKKVVLAWNWKE